MAPSKKPLNPKRSIFTKNSFDISGHMPLQTQIIMRYLNTEEASKFLSCTQRNVQKLINKGTLQPINPYHKSGYLFEKEHIEAHADKRK